MSFLKSLVDSFSAFFSGVRPSASSDPSPSPADASDRTVEGSSAGPSVVIKRVVLATVEGSSAGPSVVIKRVVLAKEEIDKAVRAEEWGLAEDAIAHYRNAQRVMLEAKAARVPLPSRLGNFPAESSIHPREPSMASRATARPPRPGRRGRRRSYS